MREKIDTTLISDNMAAYLMSKNRITKIIVGADRIAANGDTANKIGTYGLAVSANYHKIPFYVAAPLSTIDLSITSGKYIPIEGRDPDEIRKIGSTYIAPKNVKVFIDEAAVSGLKLADYYRWVYEGKPEWQKDA